MINYIPLELDYLTVFLVFVMILLKIQWFSLTLQRITRLPVQPSAVSAQCCRTIHRRPATLGPHHWHTRQLPLVESPRSCSVLYKLATVVYCSLNSTAPSYLAKDLRRLSDMPSRQRLWSSLTHQLDVRQSQCATVGDRAFATAGARLWNSLPADIVACDTLPQFRRELKTFLFRLSCPSILLEFFFFVVLAVFT